MTTTTLRSAREDFSTISLVGLAHGTSHFFHLMLPPLFPFFMQEYGLNFTQVGFLMTVFFVVSGVGQAFSGFVVDRVGAIRVLYAGILMLASSGLAVFLANGYPWLVLAALLAGMGNSVFHPVDYSILNHLVSQSRLGHAFSTHSVSGNLGWAAAPAFMLWLSSVANWHVAGLGAGLMALAMLALIHVRRQRLEYPLQQENAEGGKPARGGHFAFMAIPAIWLCFGFFFFTTLSFGALENFAAPLLAHLYGVSLAAATACFTGYLLGSSVGVVSGGFLATHWHSHQKIIGGALVAAVLMAIYLSTGAVPLWLMSILFSLMGFSVGLSNPSRDLLVRKTTTTVLGKSALGRVYGFVYSGLDTGLATAPLIFGPIMDGAHYSLVLLGMGLSLSLAIFTAVSIRQA